MRDLARELLAAAENCARRVCMIESVAHHERQLWMMVAPDQDRLIVCAALIMVTLNSAEWNHKQNSLIDVAASCDRLISLCGQIGDGNSAGRFSKILRDAKEKLRGGEAFRRLGCEITITHEEPLQAMIRTSAEWAARTMCGTGYLPLYARERSSDFLQLLSECSSFVDEWVTRIDFEYLQGALGFNAIELKQLPDCRESYDVFISYRKSDGDMCARLVYQELVHRGFKCFIDVESVSHGAYDLQILSALRAAHCLVFIKTERALTGLEDPEDHVRIELDAALVFKKNVVIVVPPKVPRTILPGSLPQSLEGLCNMKSYRLDVGEDFDFSMSKIESIVRSFAV